ncbi:hypothetical protein O7602_00880 [Micromonospora sp. WMMD1128]|uniref:hypothetical protein n=1 Tax=Micromonospora sp. WMMD1128 TaxID=3015150 RepID=UPI00248CFAD4|nr:hypothetical protein [Micromonospora sp. WMMD1128]WBB74150.1 hypothetical protein O7602_00880 [Micromonospora sp. WMMD1128]
MAWQVFRGSDAVRRGLLSRHHLRGASWVRLRQDVYADARLDRDHALACRAVLLRMPPGTLIAGPSAAYLHGVEHAADFTDDVHVLLPAMVRADSHPGVRVHHAPMISTCSGLLVPAGAAPTGRGLPRDRPPDPTMPPIQATPPDRNRPTDRIRRQNQSGPPDRTKPPNQSGPPDRTKPPDPNGPPPRTAPAVCAWETAVWADPVRAVGIIDGLLRLGAVSQSGLATEAARNTGRPGGRRASWVFSLTDGCAQSPPESHLRVRLMFAGLPQPVAQHPVRVSTGVVLHPDLAWPEFRVAVEYNGRWHLDADRMHRDRRRLNQLVEAGWLVLHVTGRRLRSEFPPLVREIRAALVARGWRP